MINYGSYKKVKLKDVATWERAQQGITYPSGCCTIQVSATRGTCGYLEKAGQVPAKDVVITPRVDINPRYFFMVIKKNMDRFRSRHQTGLNIKVDEIGEFPIELHNRETQDAIADLMGHIDAEEHIITREIESLNEAKRTFLDGMFAACATKHIKT